MIFIILFSIFIQGSGFYKLFEKKIIFTNLFIFFKKNVISIKFLFNRDFSKDVCIFYLKGDFSNFYLKNYFIIFIGKTIFQFLSKR